MAYYQDVDISAVALEIGRKLEAIRLSRNETQADIAAKAGIGLRTMSRLENGQGGTLDTLLRVMTVLELEQHFAAFIPEANVRPVERVRLSGRERQRARPKPKRNVKAPFHWGDEGKNRD